MRIELLLGAEEFWASLRRDLERAERRAFVQTFTFEGDRVGVGLRRAMERCTATDRRLLVDGYSLLYHSDRLIYGSAWLDRSFRKEVFLTHRSVERLRRSGAAVRFSNPPGPHPIKLIRRSHKKVAVFDDRVVYLGGINFSDHNFAWHDMMLRVEDAELARVVTHEFGASWEGRATAYDVSVGPLRLLSLSGRGNREGFGPVFDAISKARHSIEVVSPYLSHPFTDHLAGAVRRGAHVRVLTPSTNNKSNLARHILERSIRSGFDVLRYRGGMSHMKAMVVDRELLIVGSSNFDFMSFGVLEEHVIMTRHRPTLDAFLKRVWHPDTAGVVPASVSSSIGTRLGDVAVRVGASIAARLARPKGDIA